ncbi:polymer-forming cytoskeletal protein [Pseudoalteromonas sp. A41-2]|uniref:DUF7305 domain-containing protein n=1 Tax=Pseudoalteromonas sp. A41-2 TaxID=2785910 RepID=UPI0018CBDA8F|nr:polymer-forming cytoskeletal protein [Pseudoalteromonas sp. A41-2]
MVVAVFNKQHGFTLITVLILTSMASLVVLSSLRENIVQERLSGNFQKKLNSRLLAEKGVFEQAKLLQQTLNREGVLAVDDLINKTNLASGTGIIASDATFSATLTKNPDGELEIASLGQRFEGDAQSNLVARFGIQGAKGSSVFTNAMVGCKGVNLSGSGSIDSYDSSQGTYEETKSDDGDVSTIAGDSDVVLSGHSPIRGDVKASGVIYLNGSSPIIGNIHSNTGVYISPGSGLRVDGNVYTRGYYKHRGGRISGVVRANGDATMQWSTYIDNTQGETLDIMYGGTGDFKDTYNNQQDGVHYSNSKFNINPNVEPVTVADPTAPDYDPSNPDTNCDPLILPEKMTDIMAGITGYDSISVGPTQLFKFNTEQGFHSNGGSQIIVPTLADVFLFDKKIQNQSNGSHSKEYVFALDGLKMTSDGKMEVSGGDVILLIDGDFSMEGDTTLTIKKDSSLTVLLTGKVNIGAGAKVITEQEGLTTSGHPSLSFYSSFNSVNGVQFSGAANLYAAIYAPLTTVKLSGSGELFGSVRGAVITSSGGSGAHYDAGLLKVQNGGKPSTPARIVFLGWSYKTPPQSEPSPAQ